MNNKPICGEWHGNDVMPVELKDCLFEFNLNPRFKWAGEYLIGFREGNVIRNMNDEDICGEISVIRWCYIDLN